MCTFGNLTMISKGDQIYVKIGIRTQNHLFITLQRSFWPKHQPMMKGSFKGGNEAGLPISWIHEIRNLQFEHQFRVKPEPKPTSKSKSKTKTKASNKYVLVSIKEYLYLVMLNAGTTAKNAQKAQAFLNFSVGQLMVTVAQWEKKIRECPPKSRQGDWTDEMYAKAATACSELFGVANKIVMDANPDYCRFGCGNVHTFSSIDMRYMAWLNSKKYISCDYENGGYAEIDNTGSRLYLNGPTGLSNKCMYI